MKKSNSHKKKIRFTKADQLSEQNQMQSGFFANISHEFRTPITLILAPLEKLLEATPQDSDAHRLYLMMKRNADRLLNLINQLLDLSKLDAGFLKLEPTPVNVIELLDLLAATFAPLAENRKIKFDYQLPEMEWNVLLDIDKLEKIVINLLSNACKFTPYGGNISFMVRIKKNEQNEIDKKLVIEVSDNGIGIREDQMEKFLTGFIRLKIHLLLLKETARGWGYL